MQERIEKEMTIDEIFQKFPSKAPRLAQELTSAGLNCVGCSAATWETLEAGMYGHGMQEEEVESLVAKLNAILEEKFDPNTVTITKRALEKYLAILKEEGKEGWGLRLGEKAAGCSGFEYFLDYSKAPKEDDLVIESVGLQIHINNASSNRLMGSVIDYVDGLTGSGFKVTNPNVKSSCGCGSSHGY